MQHCQTFNYPTFSRVGRDLGNYTDGLDHQTDSGHSTETTTDSLGNLTDCLGTLTKILRSLINNFNIGTDSLRSQKNILNT